MKYQNLELKEQLIEFYRSILLKPDTPNFEKDIVRKELKKILDK